MGRYSICVPEFKIPKYDFVTMHARKSIKLILKFSFNVKDFTHFGIRTLSLLAVQSTLLFSIIPRILFKFLYLPVLIPPDFVPMFRIKHRQSPDDCPSHPLLVQSCALLLLCVLPSAFIDSLLPLTILNLSFFRSLRLSISVTYTLTSFSFFVHPLPILFPSPLPCISLDILYFVHIDCG